MNSETAVNNPYPEILKFCDWFKKEHEEKGLQYVKVSLPNQLDLKISLPDSPRPDVQEFESWFEKAIFFTPGIIEGIKNYVTSSSFSKTHGFDRLEKACARWNCENACVETVPRPDVF